MFHFEYEILTVQFCGNLHSQRTDVESRLVISVKATEKIMDFEEFCSFTAKSSNSQGKKVFMKVLVHWVEDGKVAQHSIMNRSAIFTFANFEKTMSKGKM